MGEGVDMTGSHRVSKQEAQITTVMRVPIRYVHLKGVLSEEEINELEKTYSRFLNRELVEPSQLGKDFCGV